MTSSHSKSPDIFDLSAHVQVNLRDKYSITNSRKTRSSGTIRGSNIGTTIEMTKLSFRTLFITTCKNMRINFSSNSVYVHCKIMVCNGSISTLNWPKWFRKAIDSCSWVNNNFSSIESKSHPMEWMMSAITDVTSDFTELSVINWMSTFSFHIISWLVKVSNSWNVTFLLFS